MGDARKEQEQAGAPDGKVIATISDRDPRREHSKYGRKCDRVRQAPVSQHVLVRNPDAEPDHIRVRHDRANRPQSD